MGPETRLVTVITQCRPIRGILISLAVASASTGCAVTARGGGGAAVSNGSQSLGHFGLGFGCGLVSGANSDILEMQVEGSANHVLVTDGLEFGRNLNGKNHPLGWRLRGELGKLLLFPDINDTHRYENYFEVGAVPGFWWMPFNSVRSEHRFVLSTELREAGLLGLNDSSRSLRGYTSVMILAEWWWVPCTIFGGGSCAGYSPDGGGR